MNDKEAMMSRIIYYLSSIPTIMGQVKNWPVIPTLLFRKQSIIIKLRNGCKFKVRNLMDVWIVKETCLDRDYESNSVQIQNGWTVVDVGAGIGDFAIFVAHGHPKSKIFAFEPFKESYMLMKENITLNSVKNVVSFPMAIGINSEEMTLVTTGEAVQHTTINSVTPDENAFTVKVQGVSLHDAFQLAGITNCDLLKIDCEGCEFDILLNADEAILQRIGHISLEYHDGFTQFSHIDLVKYLKYNGFQVEITPNPVHGYLGFIHAHRK